MNSTQQQTVIDRLMTAPAGQKILSELRAENFEVRKKLIAELEAGERSLQETLPELEASILKAQEWREAAWKELKQADSELARARQAKAAATKDFSGAKLRELRRRIEATAPESIREFCTEMDAELERSRKTGVLCRPGKEHMGGKIELESNHASIVRRLAAIREAQKAARGLALTASSEAEIIGKLNEIRAGLPGIEVERTARPAHEIEFGRILC